MKTKNNQLEKIAKWYSSEGDFDETLLNYGFIELIKDLRRGAVLEVGCATGFTTMKLIKVCDTLTVVDGSKYYIEKTKKRLKRYKHRVTFYKSYFEHFKPREKFDSIIITHVLEHVYSPVALLKRAATWLKKDGLIYIIVPNAFSLHRLIGVQMGKLKRPADLNKRDIRVGHRRVYSIERIKLDIKRSGLKIIKIKGNFLKPLANYQMAKWPRVLIKAFYAVGNDFPDNCAEIYVVCKK